MDITKLLNIFLLSTAQNEKLNDGSNGDHLNEILQTALRTREIK